MNCTELIVDNFAGGGGASQGIETALGRSVDFAINHDPEAIAMHRINHPGAHHLVSSVWDVNPAKLCGGRAVGLGWFSPDCTFHSKARGAKPFRDRNQARRRRGLAWLIPYWAKAVRPRVIMLENVEEFADWGPLLPDGKPDPAKRGLTFRRWHRQIENLGYQIDMRELSADRYGAPTTRKRLFVIARCDGQEIVFPEPTHGHERGLLPLRTAAECIDWSIPCPSIFDRERPLVDATLRRIARGITRYVIQDPRPFIVGIDNQSNGARDAWDSRHPLRTVTTENRFALVSAFLVKHFGGNYNGPGVSLRAPMSTVTTVDHHALVYAFLLKFYGNEREGHNIAAPIGTVTTKDRFGLVTVKVDGELYSIADIGMRMLAPRELYRAQSFPDSYTIDRGILEDGGVLTLSKSAQVRMCGNSVCPAMSEALVRANVIEQRKEAAA